MNEGTYRTNYSAELVHLVNQSLRIYPLMAVVWPNGDIQHLNFNVAKLNGCFALNSSTLSFIKEGVQYVTPYTRKAISILRKCGFRNNQDDIYVPFANGDYPQNDVQAWKRLLMNASIKRQAEFYDDCRKYCIERGISHLDSKVLSKCFCIPASGVYVQKGLYNFTVYPVLTHYSFDCVAASRIAKYNFNNGKVVFVNTDGKTYVAKGYKIIEILENSGFTKEVGLFVPFSNGEIIDEADQRERWVSLIKF